MRTDLEYVGAASDRLIMLLSTVSGNHSRRFHKLFLTYSIRCNQAKLVGYGLDNGFSKLMMMLEQDQCVDKILESATKRP